MRTLIVACVVALAAAVSAQTPDRPPDCNQLGFGDFDPTAGADLPFCSRTDAQCCSGDFLDRVGNVVLETLSTDLREEYKNVIIAYHEEIEELIDYINTNFIDCFRTNIPFSDRLSSAIGNILQKLTANIIIPDNDRFNLNGYIEELLDAVIKETAGSFGQTASTAQCITELIKSKVDRKVVENLELTLQNIRRAITTLKRIGTFLDGQRERLQDVTIPRKCVSRFIEIAFCSRCIRKTPPMCFRTCNALLRGCYSPYYTILNRQYLPLWIVVRRIVELTKTAMRVLFASENALLDIVAVTSDLRAECSLTDTSQDNRINRRSEDNICDAIIPPNFFDRLSKHNGAFDYGKEGLRFCFNALQDRNKVCPVRDPGETDDVYSEGKDIDTSRCYCTDGRTFTRDNETDQAFEMNDIENQRENPVLGMNDPEFTAELEELEAMISSMGDPIAAFLTSEDFTSVAPEEQESDSSSAGVVVSLSILLLSLLTALM